MAFTRARGGKWSVVPAAALAALLALTGCGAPAETEAPADAATGSGLVPAAEGTTQYPLTLTTWAGESVLEERPERIAVIGFSTNLDALEVLDVTPVYTMGEETEWEWRSQEWMSEIEVVDTATRRDPINVEGIAATEPDLIVAVNFIQDEVEYERLSAIAPVLENPTQVAGGAISWQDTQRMIGEALDLSAAADRVVADAEAAIDAVAAANPQFAGRTVTIATEYSQTGIDYYTGTGGTAEAVLLRMGFAPNPLAENFVQEDGVAEEQLGLLDADVLIMFYTEDAQRDARNQVPLFQAVPPVAEGRLVEVAGDDPGINVTWVMRRGASASSLPYAVEQLATWANEAGLQA